MSTRIWQEMLIRSGIQIYYICLLDPDLGSSFWGMVFILASTNLLTARIAAGCFGAALLIVLFVAKNVSFSYRP